MEEGMEQHVPAWEEQCLHRDAYDLINTNNAVSLVIILKYYTNTSVGLYIIIIWLGLATSS